MAIRPRSTTALDIGDDIDAGDAFKRQLSGAPPAASEPPREIRAAPPDVSAFVGRLSSGSASFGMNLAATAIGRSAGQPGRTGSSGLAFARKHSTSAKRRSARFSIVAMTSGTPRSRVVSKITTGDCLVCISRGFEQWIAVGLAFRGKIHQAAGGRAEPERDFSLWRTQSGERGPDAALLCRYRAPCLLRKLVAFRPENELSFFGRFFRNLAIEAPRNYFCGD